MSSYADGVRAVRLIDQQLQKGDLNIGTCIEIVDELNEHPGYSQAVLAYLRTRLKKHDYKVIHLTLELMEILVKNLGVKFAEYMTDDFMKVLRHMLRQTELIPNWDGKLNKGLQMIFEEREGGMADPVKVRPELRPIHEKILSLIQLWHDSFMLEERRCAGILNAYRRLKAEGVDFPHRDIKQRFMVKGAERSPAFDQNLQSHIKPSAAQPLSKAQVETLRRSLMTLKSTTNSEMTSRCMHQVHSMWPGLQAFVQEVTGRVEMGDPEAVAELAELLSLNDEVDKAMKRMQAKAAAASAQARQRPAVVVKAGTPDPPPSSSSSSSRPPPPKPPPPRTEAPQGHSSSSSSSAPVPPLPPPRAKEKDSNNPFNPFESEASPSLTPQGGSTGPSRAVRRKSTNPFEEGGGDEGGDRGGKEGSGPSQPPAPSLAVSSSSSSSAAFVPAIAPPSGKRPVSPVQPVGEGREAEGTNVTTKAKPKDSEEGSPFLAGGDDPFAAFTAVPTPAAPSADQPNSDPKTGPPPTGGGQGGGAVVDLLDLDFDFPPPASAAAPPPPPSANPQTDSGPLFPGGGAAASPFAPPAFHHDPAAAPGPPASAIPSSSPSTDVNLLFQGNAQHPSPIRTSPHGQGSNGPFMTPSAGAGAVSLQPHTHPSTPTLLAQQHQHSSSSGGPPFVSASPSPLWAQQQPNTGTVSPFPHPSSSSSSAMTPPSSLTTTPPMSAPFVPSMHPPSSSPSFSPYAQQTQAHSAPFRGNTMSQTGAAPGEKQKSDLGLDFDLSAYASSNVPVRPLRVSSEEKEKGVMVFSSPPKQTNPNQGTEDSSIPPEGGGGGQSQHLAAIVPDRPGSSPSMPDTSPPLWISNTNHTSGGGPAVVASPVGEMGMNAGQTHSEKEQKPEDEEGRLKRLAAELGMLDVSE
uniref:VHS domain-containing protein n=1 Tax=Chromera velia CCMP2878 TaxID=1169474 RepID=A0A0G4I5P5_9ALVE|eukprot:Cvel_11233.t1-p1 / transcript=Cvel_11233.t1 / gene=Cvel_11233 / organism=Chromera_velia_CCMP2878 / gene_product=hypothetical protein / transcript_product=hypothetical protein / location=Cvel_scaffold699:42698-50596(-) / protein_length=909 / sequence_SO=supercontig / SO=protein_coding / is_pseudo=false